MDKDFGEHREYSLVRSQLRIFRVEGLSHSDDWKLDNSTDRIENRECFEGSKTVGFWIHKLMPVTWPIDLVVEGHIDKEWETGLLWSDCGCLRSKWSNKILLALVNDWYLFFFIRIQWLWGLSFFICKMRQTIPQKLELNYVYERTWHRMEPIVDKWKMYSSV